MKITSPLTESLTGGLTSSLVGLTKASSPIRPVIVGRDIQYPLGTSLRNNLRGLNYGAYGTWLPGDTATSIANGANLFRVVGNCRWFGDYVSGGFAAGADSRDDNAFARFGAANFATLKAVVKELTSAGKWVILTFDSDCAINSVASEINFCTANVGGAGAWPNGYNVYTSGDLFGYVQEIWKMLANEFASYPYIFAYELGAEPANSLDGTWVPALLNYYRTTATLVKQIDPRANFVVGGRAYNVANVAEVLMAERTDVIYTYNVLDNGLTNATLVPTNADTASAFSVANSVPIFINQLGSRTSSDPSDNYMLAGGAVFNSRGIPFTWWQNKDHTTASDKYGLYYDLDGTGVTFIPKAARIANFQAMAGRTLAALEAAAQAAATAEGAVLFYVLPNFSNCWQDSAGTTPVTAVGQPCGLMTPVIGAGLNLTQATGAARPTVSAAASPYLIDQRPVLLFDAVNTYMSGSVTFFSSASQMTVIAAGIPANVASTQDFVACGSSTGTPKWPRLSAAASKVSVCVWQSDTTTVTITGVYSTNAIPIVMSCTRDGSANKKLYSNGLQDGATDSTADGTIATINRLRVGGASTNSPNFNGPIFGWCFKVGTMAAANQQAIERFFAYGVGAGYFL